MFSKIIDLLIYFSVSFSATVINLSLINIGFMALKGYIIHYETWQCVIAYIIISFITFHILFNDSK